ncbi:MAG: hypothetical protein M1832_001901 [Thelocarpon impressellum]|nr:MAG: hypothetical protein M1832_001901 [Thelocarpon impressellum]
MIASPFASSAASISLPAGHGSIVIDTLPPATQNLRSLTYTYPLKLISPSPTSTAKSILAFLLTYGGGLVAGDSIALSVVLENSSRLALVTQGSTKVFKAPRRELVSAQTLHVRVEAGAALLYLPDPVQPFAQSVYEQRQIYRLDARTASLCALDWVSEGRTARGEKWQLWAWKGRTEVHLLREDQQEHMDTLLLRDNILLEGEGPPGGVAETLEERLDGLGVFGTLVLRGPLFQSLANHFLSEFSVMPRIGNKSWSSHAQQDASWASSDEKWRDTRQRHETECGLLWTAAAVRGLVLVKFGAREVEGARQWLREMIHREGTAEREFGEGSLLCLR